jgi:hypothetical protein
MLLSGASLKLSKQSIRESRIDAALGLGVGGRASGFRNAPQCGLCGNGR